MPKLLVCAAVVTVLSFSIAGCSAGAPSPPTGASDSSAASSSASTSPGSASSALFSDLEWPENEVTEGIPVPSFSVGLDNLSEGSTMVIATWKGITDQEALDYVEQVKTAGFTFKPSEIKGPSTYSYSAQDKDGYEGCIYISVNYSAASENAQSMIIVTVGR